MKVVEQIKQPIYSEMEQFEKEFFRSMKTNIPLLNRVVHFIVNRKGKQMRPMLILLVAKMLNENVVLTNKTLRAASIVELIHTATLVHDDVIDGSNIRRGFFSINALWKNKIAVLVGDYLLSKGLLLCIDNDDFDLLKIISVAIREISQGELLQIEKSRHIQYDENTYFEIIRQKTATLLSACCSMAASSINASQSNISNMSKFGELIGMSFQIKDDLFDFGPTRIGKPTGIDIKEKKMTLPLIYVLNNVSKKDRKWLINTIKVHRRNAKKVRQIIDFVKQNGGLDYAVHKMNEYRNKAMEILIQYPANKYRDSLELMLNYVIERDH